MVVKKKAKENKERINKAIKKTEKRKWTKEIEDEEDGGAGEGESEGELDIDIGNSEEEVKKLKSVLTGDDIVVDKIEIKASKPVSQIKKGDKVRVDGVEFNVDAHYVLIDHGKTKEMAIEIFNPKTDKDYQLRYFSDRLEDSLEFYELEEIVYVKRPVRKVEW